MNTFPLVRDMTAEIELLVAEKRRVEYGIQVNIIRVRLKGQCHEHVLQFIIIVLLQAQSSIYVCPNLLLKSYDFWNSLNARVRTRIQSCHILLILESRLQNPFMTVHVGVSLEQLWLNLLKSKNIFYFENKNKNLK